MTGEDKNDNELEAYMQGNDGLSGEYRKAAIESPPAQLDVAILAASRKAVGSKPVGAGASFSRHWHVPASIAAVIVLSVLLVFNIPDDTMRMSYDPGSEIEYRVQEQSIDADVMDNISSSKNAVLMKEEVMTEEKADAPPATLSVAPAPLLEFSADLRQTPADAGRRELESIAPARVNAPTSAGPEANELDESLPVQPAMRRMQVEELESPQMTDSLMSGAVGEASVEISSANLELAPGTDQMTQCTTPRPEDCSEEFMPVCAVRDTGIRCVTTPCDSTESIEYSNACSACSDVDVISYTLGRCE